MWNGGVAFTPLTGIPVEEYLCELLTRLPGETDLDTIASLTPARKAAACREKSAAA